MTKKKLNANAPKPNPNIRFNENPHPDHLYSLEEVAVYAGRSYFLLRMYYAQKLLPEPKSSVTHATKTTRKFTLNEAKQIRAFFRSIGHGSIRLIKERQEHAKKAKQK